MNEPRGKLLIEGKTKKIYIVQEDPSLVILQQKDDITAGDGAKHDVIPFKGAYANQTTCNVFRLLKGCGIPVAFKEQVSEFSFIAPKCKMLPYEVVVRREAHGSYLKRNPHLEKGYLFPQLVVEFFLKTKDRKWGVHDLPCDDPLMLYREGAGRIDLYLPNQPLHDQKPFLSLPEMEVFGYMEEWHLFPLMSQMATHAFLVLEKAWQLEGGKLVDFKVEFGFGSKDKLLLADVVDNDSWRVIFDDAYIDKQHYRDGGDLDSVGAKYARVAEITSRFSIPSQHIFIWRGSEKDDPSPLCKAIGDIAPITDIVCSVHKEPVKAVKILQRLAQDFPNAVVIAYIGRSNGAGPTLSAMTTLPVITVPVNAKEFPEDVWSSLRTPSNVPVMTVLEPANAVLAALNILSARNPRIYAHLRLEIEKRLINLRYI